MAKRSKNKASIKQSLKTFGAIVVLMWQTSPRAVVAQVINTITTSVLPIATTYLAALTTTELAVAYDSGEPDKLMLYVAITTTLAILSGIWNSIYNYSDQLFRYRIEALISDQMIKRLHTLEFWRYDDAKTIDMFDRARQFSATSPYIFSQFFRFLSTAVSFFASLWLLATVNIWLALILIVVTIPATMVQLKLSNLNTKHWRKNTDKRRKQSWTESLLETPANITELRLYGLINFLLKRRSELRDLNQLQNIKYERQYMGLALLGRILQGMAEVGSYVWIILEIVARRQPLGQFVLVQQMVTRVLSDMSSLTSTYRHIHEDLVNLVDYQRFMELPVEDLKPSQDLTLQNSIIIKHLEFFYPGSNTPVLKDISLEVKRAQRVAIVGENGAGKTTLIKLLAGLYQPSSGEILVDGQNLKDISAADWHQQLAVLGQDFIHYGFATANENVWYGDTEKPLDEDRLSQALEDAEAADFVAKLPKGGDSYVNKWMSSDGECDKNKSVDISGGQWQRLALARNFYRDAPIVILDEPTSAIDAIAESRIFRRLFRNDNKTIITVSHRLSTVKKADLIFVMKHGRIIEYGDYETLVKNRSEFYKMFKDQF